jgi:hypothetical protein
MRPAREPHLHCRVARQFTGFTRGFTPPLRRTEMTPIASSGGNLFVFWETVLERREWTVDRWQLE